MSESAASTSGRVALIGLGCAGLGLGLWLRAAPVAGSFLFGDELHSLPALSLDAATLATRYDAVGSGLALPLIQKASVAIAGPSLPAVRAVAWGPSLVLVALVAWIAGREGAQWRRGGFDPASAWVAALLVATGSMFVFYGHFARGYSLAAAFCLAAFGLAMRLVPGGDAGDAGAFEAGSSGDTNGVEADEGGRRALTIAGVALFGGLAAWAHLTSVFFLLALGAGLLPLAVRGDTPLGRRVAPLAGLVGAALVAALLHLPAMSSLLAFVSLKSAQTYHGTFGMLDLLRVLTGSNLGAWLALVAVPLAAAAQLRERGPHALPIASATLLAPLLLVFASPFGDAYAWSRYLLPSAATGAVLLALGSVRAGRALAARAPAVPVWSVGIALTLTLFVASPLGPGAPRLGPFASTYLSLYRLPAFTDGAFPAPAIYAELAEASAEGALIVVESPPATNRTLHYVAALARRHEGAVRMGTLGPLLVGAAPLESSLYVDLTRPAELAGRFDRLIVHKDMLREIDRYWSHVYATPHEGAERAFMERHRIFGRVVPALHDRVIAQLASVLGEPALEDDDVVMWLGAAAGAPN